jgi:hypothetical protein
MFSQEKSGNPERCTVRVLEAGSKKSSWGVALHKFELKVYLQ